ncbi:hypothetical protein [Ramlibacter humi]|uniref:Uncharacterized protein n=1 Tax=Ramlibacter humi TaxID=2530451 RepID=A0A4Z0BCT7_9BURK|nr:hypothetical protein [Ramlibacter humi]TFY96169.1 hypothetical protein EZ216_21125 [Ramlibacter humi]
MSEHAVIVRFDYGSTDLEPLFGLEEELEEAIAAADAGEYDGNEVAVSGRDGVLYMYGPDADALFSAVKPILASTACIRNVVATLRYGPPADDIRRVEVRVAP